MDDTVLESVIRDAIERWTQLYNKGAVAELSGADVKNIARRVQLADAIRAAIRAEEPRRTPN
jgi:hypothetical protein